MAAGPHTQLAQNIVSAWLCGARFIELKTVQTLDRLEVRKPCIAVADAGYNCEWSQELTLEESFAQYLAAWVLLHVLRRRQRRGSLARRPRLSLQRQRRLRHGRHPAAQHAALPGQDRLLLRREGDAVQGTRAPVPGIARLDIPDCISDNVTLSTMHGCPPAEIEKIGLYLLNERKLHTTVKLNPTLLGPERLRQLLNGAPGLEGEGARPGLRA